MPTTTIVLIRHGETAWNAERRLQGHLDIGLSCEGERQAEALGAALAPVRFDAIVASDLQRARQTALAVAARQRVPLAVRSDPALRERGYGGFEGLLYAEIEERFPQAFAAWQRREIDAPLPPGASVGETFRQFYARSVAAILAWGAEYAGGTIALVAHGGVLECAYREALGLPLESPRAFSILNASINRFTVREGRLALVKWGEVDHLTPQALDELN
ncbi:MAG: histidine phosphatase family protein [Massilia sp.]